MTQLTQLERDALSQLNTLARKAIRSKPTLRILSRLKDKKLIEFDPFGGTAEITELGVEALSRR